MRMRPFFAVASVALGLLMAAGCGGEPSASTAVKKEAVPIVSGSSDKTVYGIACDGCNDTLVIFLRLPYNGSDPDTLDILDASRNHQVFGVPRIGDRLAMMLNESDAKVADQVVVTEDLLGLWCYKVLPTLRHTADMEGQSEEQTIRQLSDSLRQLLKVEREYGFYIKTDSVAFPYGMSGRVATTDEESVIEYPNPKRYHQWVIHDGRLVLTTTAFDSLGVQHVTGADTVEFVQLTADTLVLRYPDGDHGFYRKIEDTQKNN